MKKVLLVSTVSSLFLFGCGDKNEEVKEETQKAEKVEKEVIQEEKKDKTKLNEIGDVIKQPNYTVELMKRVAIEDTTELGPAQLTIKEIKFIKMSDITGDMAEGLNRSGYDSSKPINYMQISIEIENTTDEVIGMNSIIKDMVLNTGEQLDMFKADLLLEQHIGDIYGGVKKDVLLGMIFESDLDEIETIKFVTNNIYQPKTYDTLHESQEIDYSL